MICNAAPPVVIVPTDFVAERIRRANPAIGREAARELAAELDDIVACALKRWAAQPGFSAVDENELVQVMTYVIIEDPAAQVCGRRP